jgi:YHS domain-containing protein
MRALLELFVTIIAAMVAKALIGSIMKGFGNASASAFRQPTNAPPPAQPQATGQLHKDPVCGTYVSEATGFRSQTSGQRFFYCSLACKEKHALVAR